ncbi:hypothetical protein [Neptunicella marina]|uniref:Uncharacterized protein n=1 Tax=Neptunicella marina TaxID=2125989 RepID=A0A8J6IX45_9ALTE|nr:hypothetical protein [Neptunicella marina]MBC3767684.1 hypothetical protein [Neptunicella marina]
MKKLIFSFFLFFIVINVSYGGDIIKYRNEYTLKSFQTRPSLKTNLLGQYVEYNKSQVAIRTYDEFGMQNEIVASLVQHDGVDDIDVFYDRSTDEIWIVNIDYQENDTFRTFDKYKLIDGKILHLKSSPAFGKDKVNNVIGIFNSKIYVILGKPEEEGKLVELDENKNFNITKSITFPSAKFEAALSPDAKFLFLYSTPGAGMYEIGGIVANDQAEFIWNDFGDLNSIEPVFLSNDTFITKDYSGNSILNKFSSLDDSFSFEILDSVKPESLGINNSNSYRIYDDGILELTGDGGIINVFKLTLVDGEVLIKEIIGDKSWGNVYRVTTNGNIIDLYDSFELVDDAWRIKSINYLGLGFDQQFIFLSNGDETFKGDLYAVRINQSIELLKLSDVDNYAWNVVAQMQLDNKGIVTGTKIDSDIYLLQEDGTIKKFNINGHLESQNLISYPHLEQSHIEKFRDMVLVYGGQSVWLCDIDLTACYDNTPPVPEGASDYFTFTSFNNYLYALFSNYSHSTIGLFFDSKNIWRPWTYTVPKEYIYAVLTRLENKLLMDTKKQEY